MPTKIRKSKTKMRRINLLVCALSMILPRVAMSAVGQLTTKQTWLLDGVELRGIVHAADGQPAGGAIGAKADDFDLEVDPNYRHVAMRYMYNGSNGFVIAIGRIHCETYPFRPPWVPTVPINLDVPWPLPGKPSDTTFTVRDSATGTSRPLKDGDHIRVVGRWTIDKHPEWDVTRKRGALRVGHVHMELHPFAWTTLELVDPVPAPRTSNREVVSIAAPLFDEVYLSGDKWLGNWFAGVGSKVFIADDLSDFHNTVSATAEILAPRLAATGFSQAPELIEWGEVIMANGTGLDVASVRSVTVAADRITVTASVTAPAITRVNGMDVGDINGPANGRGVFQAAYTVRWKPRLEVPARLVVRAAAGVTTPFSFTARNVGPDPIVIGALGAADPRFTVTTHAPLTVAPHGQVQIAGTYASSGALDEATTLSLETDDPGFGPVYTVAVVGTSCPAGTQDCDGACVNTASDPLNCGACGAVCEGTCQAGGCRTKPVCTAGTHECPDGSCRHTCPNK
jgi:hypothetical protein